MNLRCRELTPSFEYMNYRYTWGAGTKRFTLEVIVFIFSAPD